jgi:hypothetical protein
MSRALVLPVFVIAALASCATVSGLADKETVDCPGGCPEEGGVTPTPTSTSTSTTDGSQPKPIDDGGLPPPDASLDFMKPDGWELVAVATVAGGAPPGCPSGFDDASDVGTNPSATANTCECATCSITKQGVCAGQPNVFVGTAGACGTPAGNASYTNVPTGGCNTDLSTTLDRTNLYVKAKLAPVTPGTCAADPAVPHPERVQMTNRRRVCDETSRCVGNLCDATVPSPFAACLASAKGSGDQGCPAGFPTKLVAGRANVVCNSNNCDCNASTPDCTGTLTYYKDTACTTGAAVLVADDTCRNPNTSGTYAAYKINATTMTTCTAKGSAPATITAADVRTICCR